MVERLVGGPASVTDLARPRPCRCRPPCQHLQVLEACGLFRSERRAGSGPASRAGRAAAAEGWISSQRAAWENRLDRLGEYLADSPPSPVSLNTSPPNTRMKKSTIDHYVTHATFSLERVYPVPAAQAFAAWADPAAKARWFACGRASGYQLDFRVGGREVNRGGPDGGPVMTFESFYRDIVPEMRIADSSTLSAGDEVMTVSVTTVEFRPAEGGTRLVLTEQGTFLDGSEEPAWWSAAPLTGSMPSAVSSQASPMADVQPRCCSEGSANE